MTLSAPSNDAPVTTIDVHVIGAGTCCPLPGVFNRNPPAILVTWRCKNETARVQDNHLLFELPDCVRSSQIVDRPPHEITRIAVSHSHPDHFAPFSFIQQCACYRAWTGSEKRDLTIYAPAQALQLLRKTWPLHFPGSPIFPDERRRDGFWSTIHAISVQKTRSKAEQVVVQLQPDVTLTAFPVCHDFGQAQAVAYRLTLGDITIAYSGDTGICGSLSRAAESANLFICEASARLNDDEAAHSYGHLNARQAAKTAQEAGVRSLALFHYTGLDSDDALYEAMNHEAPDVRVKMLLKDGQRLASWAESDTHTTYFLPHTSSGPSGRLLATP